MFPVVKFDKFSRISKINTCVKKSKQLERANFLIVNFPFVCNNIPAAPACGVYISKLIRYPRSCFSYHDFLDRWFLLTRKLLKQGLLLVKLKSSLFYVAIMTWFTVTEYLCHKWPQMFRLS